MKYLSLELVRNHVRIDHDCENDILVFYAEAAEDAILKLLNTTYDELVEEYGDVPTPVVQATLMLVDNSYKQRSPSSSQNLSVIPYNFDFMLKPYKKL